MNEFEAHESSYDHQHKKRLKEMKEMQRQVQPKKEEKGPLMQIKLGGTSKNTTSGGGFKKGGFKNAFAPAEEESKPNLENKEDDEGTEEKPEPEAADSDVTDDDDYYDPRRPTGCMPGCKSHAAVHS